jgi:uncharacterized membrane protein
MMNNLEIDLTTIVALWLGAALLLLPLAGLTIRFAILPLLEAWTRSRRGWRADSGTTARLASLEEQLSVLRGAVERHEAECRSAAAASH